MNFLDERAEIERSSALRRRETSKWWTQGYTEAWWDSLPRHERELFLSKLSKREVEEFFRDWKVWARDNQLEPDWEWDMWLLKCGRGFGKTRTCVETVLDWVEAGWARRIAIVGQGEDDVRNVMVNGESGFMECSPSWNKPLFRPSVGGGLLQWPNGCQAFMYSAADTEALRGPQFHAGWFDEPMAVPRAQRERAMDNLEFCLRLGERPRLMLSTTPKPDPWMRELERLARDRANRIHLTEGSTHDNKRNLAKNFLEKIERRYGGTKKGKQEIEGKTLGDEEGALWTEEVLDANRLETADVYEIADSCDRVIVGVDPNTKGQTTAANKKKVAHAAGIVVAGKKARERFILADKTTHGGPTKWGKAVLRAANDFDADEIVCESNQGGEMIKVILDQIMAAPDYEGRQFKVTLVFSKKDKAGRAEPVSTIYEKGLVKHVGPKDQFADLEMQMMYLHEGEDPTGEDFDRCDALVWALTRLGLKKRASSGRGSGSVGIRTLGDFNGSAQAGSGGRDSGGWGGSEL